MYKEKAIDKYKDQIKDILKKFETQKEEDKLLLQSFENKEIFKTVDHLKQRSEELGAKEGITKPFDKKMRNLSILISIPLFAVLLILTFLNVDYLLLFPLLCAFCMLPTFIRSYVVKKWYAFKEEHKLEFYEENREDLLILKGFVGDLLNNIRSELLDLKVPLQLIKFVLHSRDYEGIKLINERTQRGTTQYFLSFDYPEGMEPFPLPEELKQTSQMEADRVSEPAEKNFVVLTNLSAKNGIIEQFVPTLREEQADKINDLLNQCEFSKAPQDVSIILPNYSPEMPIYCLCGEILEIQSVQVCSWKDSFKFYLFEGKPCDCGETIYALSLMDEEQDIPEEFKDIF